MRIWQVIWSSLLTIRVQDGVNSLVYAHVERLRQNACFVMFKILGWGDKGLE